MLSGDSFAPAYGVVAVVVRLCGVVIWQLDKKINLLEESTPLTEETI